MKPLTPEKLINDLEKIFKRALLEDNLTIALKVKDLQSRILAGRQPQKNRNGQANINELSDIELANLIGKLNQ